jgi:hypothetical protein
MMGSSTTGRLSCSDPVHGRLLDGYVAGTLSEAEESTFEGHYFSCPGCLQELQFRQALRPALEAFGTASAPWRVPLLRAMRAAAAAAVVLLAGYAAYVSFYRVPIERTRAGDLAREKDRLEGLVSDLSSSLDRARQDLKRAAGWSGPVRVHSLAPPIRSGTPEQTVTIGKDQPYVLFAVEVSPPRPGASGGRCRLEVVGGDEQPRWSAELTARDLSERLRESPELTFVVPASALQPGRHALRVVHLAGDQQRAQAHIPFNVEVLP